MTAAMPPFKRRLDEVAADATLRPTDGWEGLEVRWLVTDETADARQTVVGTSVFPPGAKHDVHRHPHAEEWEYVLRGRGIKRVGDVDVPIEQGEMVFVPRDAWHGVANIDAEEPLVTIWGYCGAASLDRAGYVLPREDGLEITWPPAEPLSRGTTRGRR